MISLKELTHIAEFFQNSEDDTSEIDLECAGWQEFLFLYLQLKVLLIVYLRLINGDTEFYALDSKKVFQILQDQNNRGFMEFSETVFELLYELRWSSWDPDSDTQICVSDIIAQCMYQNDGRPDAFREYLNDVIVSENDRDAVSQIIGKFYDDVLDPLSCEELVDCHVCIRRLFWTRKALHLFENGKIDHDAGQILREEIDRLVAKGYCFCAEECVYCLEAVIDSVYSYEHYPSLFSPFRLTVLEMLAKEACAQVGEGAVCSIWMC